MSDLMGKHCIRCNGYIEPWSEKVLCFDCWMDDSSHYLNGEVKRLTDIEEKYYELLNWVESKTYCYYCSGRETRHATALRYIKERESSSYSCDSKEEADDKHQVSTGKGDNK